MTAGLLVDEGHRDLVFSITKVGGDMTSRFRPKIAIALLFLVVISGCSSRLEVIVDSPRVGQESLGYVSGDACGALILGHPALAVIPIALNGRIYRARQEALAKAPGATRLIDVSVEERWFWWLLGTSRCTTVSGRAVR